MNTKILHLICTITSILVLCVLSFNLYKEQSNELKYNKVQVVYSDGEKDTLIIRKYPNVDVYDISDGKRYSTDSQIIVTPVLVREIKD